MVHGLEGRHEGGIPKALAAVGVRQERAIHLCVDHLQGVAGFDQNELDELADVVVLTLAGVDLLPDELSAIGNQLLHVRISA
jgi:hypothetical protein